MRTRLRTRLWWTALLVWLLSLGEAFYPPGPSAIAGGGDGRPRRPPLPSWVRARRFLSLFGSSSSQVTRGSESAAPWEGGGHGLVVSAGGSRSCRASGPGLAASSAMAAQQAGGDMGDAADGGCSRVRVRGGTRGDFSTEGVAKAAQLFLDDLSARMQRMDKPPQASFRHSYGGEFEVRCAVVWDCLGGAGVDE